MDFDATTVKTTLPTVVFYSLRGDASRYVVYAEVPTGSITNTKWYYACASAAWTDDELNLFSNLDDGWGRVPARCPSGVTVKNEHLILDKAALTQLEEPGFEGKLVMSLSIAVSSSTTSGPIAITAPSTQPVTATPSF